MPARRTITALALLPALLLPAAAVDAKTARQRWAVVAVTIRGDLSNNSAEYSPSYAYRGTATYRGRGSLGSWDLTPKRGRLASLLIRDVSYTGNSVATISEESGKQWICSTPTPVGAAPRTVPVTAFFSATELRLNWTLVWPAVQCEQEAPAWLHPILPADLGEQRYSLAALRKVKPGKTLGVLIDIRKSWKDKSGEPSVHWTGKVSLKRLR